MNQVELLRHVADNLEAGKEAGAGLIYNGRTSGSIDAKDIRLDTHKLYTLAPRTHEVNGFTVPAPIDVEPVTNVVRYTAATDGGDLASPLLWTGSEYCLLMLTRNVLFATKEAAQQNTLALLGRDPALGVDGV